MQQIPRRFENKESIKKKTEQIGDIEEMGDLGFLLSLNFTRKPTRTLQQKFEQDWKMNRENKTKDDYIRVKKALKKGAAFQVEGITGAAIHRTDGLISASLEAKSDGINIKVNEHSKLHGLDRITRQKMGLANNLNEPIGRAWD